jgi:hypothetical protein
MDATEIWRSPPGADGTPFVNLRDPAEAPGPDGKPAVSRRARIWEDVPDEKWNDWRWQFRRLNTLEDLAQVLNS